MLPTHRNETQSLLRRQNDDAWSRMGGHVEDLKRLTMDLGDEIRLHNDLLDDMGDRASFVDEFMGGITKRLRVLSGPGGCKQMLQLSGFLLFFFLLLWFLS